TLLQRSQEKTKPDRSHAIKTGHFNVLPTEENSEVNSVISALTQARKRQRVDHQLRCEAGIAKTDSALDTQTRPHDSTRQKSSCSATGFALPFFGAIRGSQCRDALVRRGSVNRSAAPDR